MMKAMPLKVECSNKISPLLHPYFCNINNFSALFKSQFHFTHNLVDLQLFWMCSSNLNFLNFLHLSVNKIMPWVRYCLCEANFCLRSRRKINSHKIGGFVINVSTPGNVAETILVIAFVKLLFSRNYHNIKNIISYKLDRRIKNSVKHPRWSLFANIVR